MKKFSKIFFPLLKKELELWKEEGIISEEQAGKIKERYRILESQEKVIPSTLITVISIMGSLLVGAGVILFIASNWQAIPKTIRLGIIFGTIFTVNHFGYYLKYTKGNYPKIGSALLLLGSLLFGGGIWLVAQTYHITSRYHSGILFWSIGILPIAWLLNMESILILSSALLTCWTVWKSIDFSIPNYFYLILMLFIILPLCYKQKAKVALFISLIGVSLWFGFGPCMSYFKESILLMVPCFIGIGVFLYSVGSFHSLFEKIKGYQSIYKFLGVFILYVFIYILSFKESAHEMAKLIVKPLPSSFWYLLGLPSLLSIGAILSIFRLPREKSQYFSRLLNYEIASIIFFLLFPILILILPNITFYAISSNLILLGLTIGVIFFGYHSKNAFFINLGFIFFGIHFLTRYIDWGYKYISRSLFYIITGIILILIATFMEKQRRKFIKAIRRKNDS